MESSHTKTHVSTRMLTLGAMFIALQVVLSKFLMIQATPTIRLSIDAVPIFLAAIWFGGIAGKKWVGPLAGGIVGLLADAVGTLLFPTAGAYFPPLTLGFILIGVISGFLAMALLREKRTLWRIALVVIITEFLASYLYKSLALSWLMGTPYIVMLGSRALPVGIVTAANTLIVFALDKLLAKKLFAKPVQAEQGLTGDAPMSYEQALDYIHHVTWRGSRFGLERTHELLEKLGNPHKALKFVHFAGTNGKGSTLSMLASIFRAAGYNTGSYISPFIDRFNERMQVNGVFISDDELAGLTAYVKPFADGMADHPTEFELVTAIAMLYFQAHACDIVMLEVGMGGELDSTNVIDTPELAIITNIGLDHTRELGPTIADIAHAKAGIIKENGDVLIYGKNKEADAVFTAACQARHARLHITDHSRARETGLDLEALRFDFLPLYHDLSCRLVGRYQLNNAAVALTAVELLQQKGWKIDEQAIRSGLAAATWPARFEILGHDPLLIIDGGHNPQGVEAAVKSLRAHLPGQKIVFLLGVMADKDAGAMLLQIIPLAKAIITVTPDNPRALSASLLAARAKELGFPAIESQRIPQGIDMALQAAGPDGTVCVLGSLYMLGDIRAIMGATTI